MTGYDKTKKLAELLGFKHYSQATTRLLDSIILDISKKLGMNKCYRCNQEITRIEDVSIDHKIPWRSAGNKEKCQELFWDMGNLSLSHKWCNIPHHSMKNKHKYIGIKQNNDWYQSTMSVNKKTIILGYSKNPKYAGFFRDIGVFKYRDGCGKLNFEFLRDYYKTIKDREWRSFTDEEINRILG